MKKVLSPAYYLRLKRFIAFKSRNIFYFFSNGHIRNVVSTLPNVQFNVEIHKVVSKLLNVVNFNVDMHNVLSTLI